MTAAKFKNGDRVRKITGSRWQGKVVGFYQTALTPEGYAVESETEKGSVQIYPAAALERVPAQRIYISGPMTGIEDNNFPAFNKAAEVLRKVGWDVVNPADHGVIDGASWSDYLRLDLAQLVQCTDIYFLHGWTGSKGAALEYLVAQELGIRMSFAPDAEGVTRF